MEKKKVLVIDDEAIMADLIADFLTEFGYQPKTLNNGTDVNQELESFEPDLITLDLHMPGMSGLEVLESMKKSEKGRNTPVIIISVTDAFGLGLESLRQCKERLIKPVHIKEFKEKIQRALA